jgi:transposase
MCYPSDLTDAEWHLLEPLLPVPKATGRPRKWDLRRIINGIFYLVRSGCAWRMLPREFPPWPTVHDFYRRLRKDGTWEAIHAQLREQVRVASGRNAQPSGAILDSQSIKTTEKGALLDAAVLALTVSKRSMAASVTSWLIRRVWFSKSTSRVHNVQSVAAHASSWSL